MQVAAATTALAPATTPAARAPASSSSPGLLATADGLALRGVLHGAAVPAEGELVFTTAATGWGEILTDPSYAGQMVVLTHPMAGNYRIDVPSSNRRGSTPAALVVTRMVDPPPAPVRASRRPARRGRHSRHLGDRHEGADPGPAQRRPSPSGHRRTPRSAPRTRQAGRATAWRGMRGSRRVVATREPFVTPPVGERERARSLVDYGVKRSLLAALAARGLEITALPPDASAADVAAAGPDLIVLSPGPGDPSRMGPRSPPSELWPASAVAGGRRSSASAWAISCWRLRAGGETRRLAVGHHGGNHAVLEVATRPRRHRRAQPRGRGRGWAGIGGGGL